MMGLELTLVIKWAIDQKRFRVSATLPRFMYVYCVQNIPLKRFQQICPIHDSLRLFWIKDICLILFFNFATLDESRWVNHIFNANAFHVANTDEHHSGPYWHWKITLITIHHLCILCFILQLFLAHFGMEYQYTTMLTLHIKRHHNFYISIM